MKHTEYKVIYLNGCESTFYTFSVLDAFCAATLEMSKKGRDSRIKYITDEHGNNYNNFELTYKTN